MKPVVFFALATLASPVLAQTTPVAPQSPVVTPGPERT